MYFELAGPSFFFSIKVFKSVVSNVSIVYGSKLMTAGAGKLFQSIKRM